MEESIKNYQIDHFLILLRYRKQIKKLKWAYPSKNYPRKRRNKHPFYSFEGIF